MPNNQYYKVVARVNGRLRSSIVDRKNGGIWYPVGEWVSSDYGPLFVYSNLMTAMNDGFTCDTIFLCEVRNICHYDLRMVIIPESISKSRLKRFWGNPYRVEFSRDWIHMSRPRDTVFVESLKLIREVTPEERDFVWEEYTRYLK